MKPFLICFGVIGILFARGNGLARYDAAIDARPDSARSRIRARNGGVDPVYTVPAVPEVDPREVIYRVERDPNDEDKISSAGLTMTNSTGAIVQNHFHLPFEFRVLRKNLTRGAF